MSPVSTPARAHAPTLPRLTDLRADVAAHQLELAGVRPCRGSGGGHSCSGLGGVAEGLTTRRGRGGGGGVGGEGGATGGVGLPQRLFVWGEGEAVARCSSCGVRLVGAAVGTVGLRVTTLFASNNLVLHNLIYPVAGFANSTKPHDFSGTEGAR